MLPLTSTLNKHVLCVEHVSHRFERVRVLRDVNAAFELGQPHIILGANGSGKSTLLSILAGRVAPQQGRAFLHNGKHILAEGRELQAITGWLGHELGLYLDLTAFENITFHCQLYEIDPNEIWSSWSNQLQIEAFKHRKLRILSRGQRQKIALMRACIRTPKVLLLDEPSTGLDVQSVQSLAKILCDLSTRDMLVVVITHDDQLREALNGHEWAIENGVLRSVLI